MGKINRSTLKARNNAVAAGIDKHLTSPTMVNGISYTPAALKAVFAAQTSAVEAVDAVRKQLSDLVIAARAAGATADATYDALRHQVVGQYGKGANAILNDFGMSAPKRKGPQTVQAKVEGNTKRLATRAARHTMGSRQKLGVTGNVTGVVVTPVVEGVQAASPALPPVPGAAATG